MLSVFFMDPFELGLGDSRPEGKQQCIYVGKRVFIWAKEVGGHLQLEYITEFMPTRCIYFHL